MPVARVGAASWLRARTACAAASTSVGSLSPLLRRSLHPTSLGSSKIGSRAPFRRWDDPPRNSYTMACLTHRCDGKTGAWGPTNP